MSRRKPTSKTSAARPSRTEEAIKFLPLKTACPTCGSKAGAPCMERGKNPGIRNAHSSRAKAAADKAK